MTNPFALFSLPPSFTLDTQALEREYIALQQRHHPDRAAGKGAQAQAEATGMALAVNDAYQTLKNPLKRAQYLLAQQGIRINSEGDTVKPAPATLMEVMALREELEEAATPETLLALRARVQERERALLAELSHAFAQGEHGRAAQLAIHLNYLVKILEELRLALFKRQATAHG